MADSALVSSLRRSPFVLLLAAAAALALVVINEAGYSRASDALVSTGERLEAQGELNELQRRLLDAETGQRGFLLSERDIYLEPYRAALASIAGSLERLHLFYDDERTRQPIQRIERAAQSKLSEMALSLEQHAEGKHDQWRELLLSDIGREKMDELRRNVSLLLQLEYERIGANRAALERTLMLSRLGVNLMALVALAALVLAFRKTRALDRAQTGHARSLAAERDLLELEVARRTADLTELARHLQTTREDERARLARDLHDELGALLTAAKLDAARLKRTLGTMSAETEERLKRLHAILDQGIALKRRIIEDLRPSSLSNLGLVAALEIQAREFAQRTEIAVRTELQPVVLSDSAQITVYRLVQESLTNIAKYAKARHVTVRLEQSTADEVRVTVHDDGVGFDPGTTRRSAHGLLGMHYRVEAEGGSMKVQSAAGRGSSIQVTLPAATECEPPERVQPG